MCHIFDKAKCSEQAIPIGFHFPSFGSYLSPLFSFSLRLIPPIAYKICWTAAGFRGVSLGLCVRALPRGGKNSSLAASISSLLQKEKKRVVKNKQVQISNYPLIRLIFSVYWDNITELENGAGKTDGKFHAYDKA